MVTATSSPTVHERDCAPCDAARAVYDEVAAYLDPNDNWPETEIDGVTEQQRLTERIAGALHRVPLGGGSRG